MTCGRLCGLGLLALLVLSACAPRGTTLAPTSTGSIASTGERIRALALHPDVTATIVTPPGFDARKHVELILYALPNGNTTAETMGRTMADGVGWRYDIQHIAAQTRAAREHRGMQQAVVVYLEAAGKSWPDWRRLQGYDRANARIVSMVDEVRAELGNPADLSVTLTGHSGGGSFTWGFIDGQKRLPDWLTRIGFLDSNYSFEPRHGVRITEWLQRDTSNTLVVLAYDDREIMLDGKKVVTDSGGTWRATHRMLDALKPGFRFTTDTLGAFRRYRAPGIDLLLHPNPSNRILHTEMIGEMNGYLHALLVGRPGYSDRNSVLVPARAYTKYVVANVALPAAVTRAIPARATGAMSGTAFMSSIASRTGTAREEAIRRELLAGNIPSFLRALRTVRATAKGADSVAHTVEYEVMPDYLAIGSDKDFVRIPMTPGTAQAFGDAFGFVLPTRRMVNDIWAAATTHLEPLPLTESREASATFLQHHRMIERQLAGAPPAAFVAGIKKDLVVTPLLTTRPGKVAIYGWHYTTGAPIQPLYTGHGDWYVDYSHGVRPVRRTMRVDGVPVTYERVLADSSRHVLLSDEGIVAKPHYGLPSAVPGEVRARVDSATRGFLLEWQEAWQETQQDRPTLDGGIHDYEMRDRNDALHCHFTLTPIRLRPYIITDTIAVHATCPRWYPRGGPVLLDERRSLDGGLKPIRRPRIAALRNVLRRELDSAASQLPGDADIAGQRVRFALDANDIPGAVVAAADCTSSAVKCARLHALVFYHAGLPADADSGFVAAAAMLPDSARCAWNDIRVLLEPELRRDYAAMSCEARREVEARFWWLSDPLYVERGNERRAEHFARKTVETLLSPLGFDGRQHWTMKEGGRPVAENNLRYGWPTQMYWAGWRQGDNHASWLRQQAADTAPPYVVREYTRDRLHTAPRSTLLRSPFSAQATDWQLNPPAGDDDWWPVEHFARDRSRIAQLPEGQSVMLRRATQVRFAWAGDADSAITGPAVLLQSRAVGTVDSVAALPSRRDAPVLVDAPLDSGTTLLSIEVPGDSTRPAARTRFAVDVPPPLTTHAGERGLSQPLLFRPSVSTAASVDAGGAIGRMFGSTSLRERRLGVFWEAYGFAPTDTVDISVEIVRTDSAGVLGLIPGFSRITGRRDGAISIRFNENTNNAGAVWLRDGNSAIAMRSLVLELSALDRGKYLMTVSMQKRGVLAVTSQRAFTLR